MIGKRFGAMCTVMAEVACGCVLLVWFAGCGPDHVNPPTREALEARAKIYWDLRLKKDWNAIYDLLSPEDRRHLGREAFLEGRSELIRIVEYRLEVILVDGNAGETTAESRWRFTIPKDKQPYRETVSKLKNYWVYADGDWYLDWDHPQGETQAK